MNQSIRLTFLNAVPYCSIRYFIFHSKQVQKQSTAAYHGWLLASLQCAVESMSRGEEETMKYPGS